MVAGGMVTQRPAIKPRGIFGLSDAIMLFLASLGVPAIPGMGSGAATKSTGPGAPGFFRILASYAIF